MAVTLAQLHEYRDRLVDAKFSGALIVQDSSGEMIRYRSHSELGRRWPRLTRKSAT